MATTWPPNDVTDEVLYSRSRLGVDVYHINIGTGDAAIYYLVEQPPAAILSNTPKPKPYIHRAALIDGGLSSGAIRIDNFLKVVPGGYEFNKTQGGRAAKPLSWPPFDAIVITHWDIDHWQGVIKLIAGDLRSEWAAKASQTGGASPDTDPANLTWLEDYLSPYMKYADPSGGVTTRSERASTYFYIPYWGFVNNANLKSSQFPTEQGSGEVTGVFWPEGTPGTRPITQSDFLGDTDFLNFSVKAGGGGPPWCRRLCRLRAGQTGILGASLFTQWKPLYDQCLRLKNPCALARLHKAALPMAGKPRSGLTAPQQTAINAVWDQLGNAEAHDVAKEPFLVIAQVNGVTCGDQHPSRAGRSHEQELEGLQDGFDSLLDLAPIYPDPEPLAEIETPLRRIEVDRWASQQPFGSRPGPHPVTTARQPTNNRAAAPKRQTSRLPDIVNLPSKVPSSFNNIISPARRDRLLQLVNIKVVDHEARSDTELANVISIGTLVAWTNGQISHYSAGDTNWQNELRIVAWIHYGSNAFQCVRACKINHHGSGDSTAIGMIRYLRPRVLVVSCATNAHPHPSPEVILWLYYWFNATFAGRTITEGTNGYGWLQATAFPWYIRMLLPPQTGQFADQGSRSFVGELQAATNDKSIQGVYQASLNTFAARLPGETTTLGTLLQNPPNREAIYKKLHEAWPTISRQVWNDSVNVPGTNSAAYQPIDMAEQVSHIAVICRPFSSALRQDMDGYIDGSSEARKAKTLDMNFDRFTGKAKPIKVPTARTDKTIVLSEEQKQLQKLAKSEPGTSQQEKAWSTFLRLRGLDANLELPQELKTRNLTAAQYDYNLLMQLEPQKSRNDKTFDFPDPEPRRRKRKRASTTTAQTGDKIVVHLQRRDFSHLPAVGSDLPQDPTLDIPAPTNEIGMTPSPGSPFVLLPNSSDSVNVSPRVKYHLHDSDPLAIMLMLTEMPMLELTSNATLAAGNRYPAAQQDALRTWLLTANGADDQADKTQSSLEFVIRGSVAATLIDKAVLTVSDVDADGSSISIKLAFDNSTASLRSNLPSLASDAALPDSGFYLSYGMLVFGLTQASSNWTLNKVLAFVGLKAGSVISLVDALSADATMCTLTSGAIWYMPLEGNLTVQRMQWRIGQDVIDKWLSWLPGVKVSNALLTTRRTSRKAPSVTGYAVIKTTQLLATFDLELSLGKAIRAALEFDIAQDTLMLSLSFSGSSLSPATEKTITFVEALTWIFDTVLSELGIDHSDVSSWMPNMNAAAVRRLRMWCPTDPVRVCRIAVDVEVRPGWKDVDGQEISFLCAYTWSRGSEQPHSINAQLWLQPKVSPTEPPEVMPSYEPALAVFPSAPAASRVHLFSLMPGEDIKSGFPAELDVSISELSIDVTGRTVSFTGKIEMVRVPDNDMGVWLFEVDLEASYTWAAGGRNTPERSSYEIKLSINVELPPPPGMDDDDQYAANPTVIGGAVELTSASGMTFYRLTAYCNDLYMNQLVQFFPEEDQDIVEDILGHMNIHDLKITYDYSPQNGLATRFSISAILVLGPVELILSFRRDIVNPFDFTATIQVASGVPNATIKDILLAFFGDDDDSRDMIASIPDFVNKIDLANGKASFSLRILSEAVQLKPTPVNGSLTTALILDLPGPGDTSFEVAFVQTTIKPAAAATGPRTNRRNDTKRIAKVTMGGLPWDKVPKPPVVGQITPAFDQLGFYWVMDPGAKGFTAVEIDKLNRVTPVQYKIKPGPPLPPNDPRAQSTIVLGAGWHFVILDSGGHGTPKALLDYPFMKPKAPAPLVNERFRARAKAAGGFGSFNEKTLGRSAAKVLPAGAGDDGDGTTKGALDKDTGLFKISNVGIRYENGELIIFLDILAKLGPIDIALMGFGVGLDLKKLSGGLRNISNLTPNLHLAGMGIDFNRPPVAIAGTFVDRSNKDTKMYVGGVALTVMPYSFMAVGAYGEVKKPDVGDTLTLAQALDAGRTFKTVFIFAKLNGPLIEFGFATVGGITLGFGYNSDIRMPKSVNEIATFPFLANTAAGGDETSPLAVMQRLSSTDPNTGVVTPREGSFWLAAGIEAKAFQSVNISAVVVIEFNPYVSLGLFARAIAQMPPPPAPREVCFMYAELDLMATVDFHAGSLMIMAELSPNSFVLNPFCHLTGGFALCYWFGDNPHAGDFVFSLGGFHPAFDRPSHYPRPSRLGITWGLSDALMIRGNAYFAVTPKAVMGGGSLNAVFNMGPLHAWFLAHADFLITFHPFHFIADIGVEVGIDFTLDLLFVTIHICLSLGAEVHLEGTPIGGHAHVHFWAFGFTVPFGAETAVPDPLPLSGFRDLLMQIPDPTSAKSEGPGVDTMHVLSVEQGRFAEKQTDTQVKQGEIWEVKRGGFVFRVQSRVPVQGVDQPDWMKVESTATFAAGDAANVFATPMHLTQSLTSSLHVRVTKIEEAAAEPIDFRVLAPVMKDLPSSIWGPYDDRVGKGSNNIQSLLSADKGTRSLLVGASFKAPPPRHSFDKITKVDVVKSASLDVFGDESHPTLSDTVTFTDKAWGSAEPVPPGQKTTQWDVALATWQQPGLNLDAAPLDGEDKSPKQTVVSTTIDVWTRAFGWSGDNVLKNDVTFAGGEKPLVWGQFENLYMVAPMVSVA